MTFLESDYENAVLQLMQDGLGYAYRYGPDIERDYQDPLYEDELMSSIARINPGAPQAAIDDALFRIRNIENGTLVQRNRTFTDYLQNGIESRYFENGKERNVRVLLIDYDHPDNNSFVAVNQWTVVENAEKRPDVILFVNGLPLVVMELKSPSRDETEASEAYSQLRNYMHDIPSLFMYNAILVMSDLATSKAGTITSGEDRFMEWKTKDGVREDSHAAAFDTFFLGMFAKERLLDLIQNFLCFDVEGAEVKKVLAAYHQYFAVKKAVESTLRASETDGKGGVFWHTQGSGKSLSMVFYAHALQKAMQSPTIVVLTDRNDLDDQLYGQFARCADFLRQQPEQAADRENLTGLLKGRQANGIFFTTMQKFTENSEPFSDRRNIVVMADEAHRSQYGLTEKVQTRLNKDGVPEAKTVVGAARLVRNSLPNATYIGFTGTPISQKDRSTREVFGDYIDIYDMTQAVEDNATRPVYYESRVIRLKLDKDTLETIDREYDMMADKAEALAIEQSKQSLAEMDALLGADVTIDSLVTDILEHYESTRADLLTGKAMIVAYSRPIAMKIYNRILELRPDWQDRVAVVMTRGNNDPEEWNKVIGTKAHKENLARTFKDNNSPLKIAIVVDMWLTGFDIPSLATMYVYKPMRGHNLMQAIARVNRVFEDKEGGLIVDYIGIAQALKEAMRDYTNRDRKNFDEMDVATTAYPKFQEKLEICRDLMHGYDYKAFMQAFEAEDKLQQALTISRGVDFLLGKRQQEQDKDPKEQTPEVFIREALGLHQALSLCASIVQKKERLEAACFEAVRVTLMRILRESPGKKLDLKEINARINELLKQSIKSEGVTQLTTDAEFSLFDPAFLKEIAKMEEKNLAIELLKRLLKDQIRVYKRTNVVRSTKFSETIQNILNRYLNGLLTNEQVIEELLKLAKDIAEASEESNALGLSEEEAAFYDALTRPEAVKDFYEHDELIAMTKELTDKLRKSRTIDWQKKASARAAMRNMVKRLLKKYKYPPEGVEDAMQTVIAQCEMWADTAS